MSTRRLRIGVLQLAGHPAFLAGDLDLLKEPCPRDLELRLARLRTAFPSLRACSAAIKAEYIRWARTRFQAILSTLRQWGDPPDVLLCPECLVPLDALDLFREYAKSTSSVVLAGTHSRPHTPEADRVYNSLGIDKKALAGLPSNCPGLLPILLGDTVTLRPKLRASPYEASEVEPQVEDLPTIGVISAPTLGVDVGPLICAEALQRPHFDRRPSLVAIIANDHNPSQFEPHIQTFVATKHAVAMANDAQYGGSGVFLLYDKRSLGWWWFEPPINGRLPVGEAYLEIHINLDAPAPESGTTAPRQTGHLHRLASILGQDDPVLPLEERARQAALERNTLVVGALCKELETLDGASPVTRLRWRHLHDLLDAGNATDAWIETLSHSILTTNAVALPTLEQQLACRAHSDLQGLVSSPAVQSVAREVAGELVVRAQKIGALCHQGVVSPSVAAMRPPRTEPPIGRADLTRLLRQELAGLGRPILAITGSPGIGKTTVLSAAFSQSGIDPLFIDCPVGCSPDYLYEYLLRAIGFVPTGDAPRQAFDPEELRRALSGVRSLWFSNVQNLVESSTWVTEGTSSFFESLAAAFGRSEETVALVFESTRELPLPAASNIRVVRRRVPVLPSGEAIDLLRLRMRRLAVPDDAVTDEQRSNLVRLLDGHPYLLGLAADACSRVPAADVIKDIKGRGKLYQSMASGLLSSTRLSAAERTCLAALTRCRAPIPISLLDYVVPHETAEPAVAGLSGTSLVERLPDQMIETTPFLRQAALSSLSLERAAAVRFHDAASRYYSRVARSAGGTAFLRLAIEANYHAASAGQSAPFYLQGLADGLVAAARQHFRREEYDTVVQLLEPLLLTNALGLSDDVTALLAKSYAWSNRTDDSIRLAKLLIARNPTYIGLLVEAGDAALRSKRLRDARKALREAELSGAHDYRFLLLRAKIREREGDRLGAFRDYESAVEAGAHDAWPFFFFAQFLKRVGRPKEALAVVERARVYANENPSVHFSERLESALLSVEMFCLVLLGDLEAATAIAGVALGNARVSSETILSAAYVEAAAVQPFEEAGVLAVFTRALARLDAEDSGKAHTRATIALMRGKLLERLDDLATAEGEYARAAQLDPYNAHMKECHLRLVLRRISRSRRSGQEPVARLQAQEALRILKALLVLDPTSDVAKDAQADLFTDFGLQ